MKSSVFKTAVFVCGFALLGTQGVFAQPGNQGGKKTPPTFSELIEKLDANEDGKLSESEVKGPLKDRFSEIDANEDGFITEEEFENAPKPERRKR